MSSPLAQPGPPAQPGRPARRSPRARSGALARPGVNRTGADRLALQHQRDVATIAGGVTSVVVSTALGADPAAIATWYWGAVDGLITRISVGYSQTRNRAMRYLPRHAALSGASVQAAAGSLDVARLRERLRIVGPVGFKSAIAAGQDTDTALRNMATNMGGVADEAVRNGDRDVITQTATRGQGVIGWRRRLSGRACGFCSMLASRGAVYVDRRTATVAKDGAAYHPHCHCWAEPLYSRQEEPAEVRKLQRQWSRVTAGHTGADAQRVWRRHWNRVNPPRRSLASQANTRFTGGPDLSSLNVEQLRALARERGLPGFSKLRKQELVDALGPGMVAKVAPAKAAAKAAKKAAPAKAAPRKLRPETSPSLTPEELSVYAARRHAATQLPLVNELAANGASARAVTARVRTHMRRLNEDIVPVDAAGKVLSNTADATAARYIWRRPGATTAPRKASPAEMAAVKAYANSDAVAARVNGTLRRGEPLTPEIERIDAAMAVSRLDEDLTLYRGVNELEALGRQGGVRRALGLDPDRPLPADLVGHEFRELGFASTSTRRTLAEVFGTSRDGDFLLEIRAPRGTHAVMVPTGEAEVLLDRGLRYRVVGDRVETRMVGMRADEPRRTRVLTVEVVPAARPVDVIDLSAPIPRALAGDEIFAAEFATASQMARTALAVERAARAGDDIVAAARAAVTPAKAAKKVAAKKAPATKAAPAKKVAAPKAPPAPEKMTAAALRTELERAGVTGIPTRIPKATLVDEVADLRAGGTPAEISARLSPQRIEGKVSPKAAKLPKVADPGDVRAQAMATNPRNGGAYNGPLTPEIERAGGASYTMNCSRVVIAYEMRRRGIRVTAGAGTPGGDTTAAYMRSFRMDGKYATRVADDLSRSMSARQVADEVETWPRGARGIVTIKGHTLNVERDIVTGRAVFIDAQAASSKNPVMNLSQFTARVKSRGVPSDRWMAVARIDDLDLSDYSLHYVESPELHLADGQVLKTDYPQDPDSDHFSTFEEIAAMTPDNSYP